MSPASDPEVAQPLPTRSFEVELDELECRLPGELGHGARVEDGTSQRARRFELCAAELADGEVSVGGEVVAVELGREPCRHVSEARKRSVTELELGLSRPLGSACSSNVT